MSTLGHNNRRKRVAIIHPDLGIGGAENLIINLALALEDKNYYVKVFTPHFDPNRCFEEAKQLNIEVRGSWFPRQIAGRFIAMCAYIRMMICAIWVLTIAGGYDYYILDQVSFPIPLLRLRNRNVLFYCHYPDKLLSTERTSFMKRAYRVVLDFVEEVTTGCARAIVVNSNFTLKVFYDSFPIIRKHFNHKPEVLYPAIKASSFIKSKDFKKTISEVLNKEVTEDTIIITSLNRYERKKNIPLALKSFHYFLKQDQGSQINKEKVILVIAGGYDPRLPENVEHYEELASLARELKIENQVVFLKSISNDVRLLVLENTKIMLYTPENEHFGIVPVEAMHMGCIVIACNSGGPVESVHHGKTGYLLSPNEEEWGNQISKILNSSKENQQQMIAAAKQRVLKMFTSEVFADQLDRILQQM